MTSEIDNVAAVAADDVPGILGITSNGRALIRSSDPEMRQLMNPGGVGVHSSTQLAPVWGCVTLIADLVAKLPLQVHLQQPDGTRLLLNRRPLARLLRRPSPYIDPFAFWRTCVLNLVGHGNAYLALGDTVGEAPGSMVLIPPEHVEAREYASDPYRVSLKDGRAVTVERERMVHIMGYTFDGVLGLSPIRHHAVTMSEGTTQRTYAERFYAQGVRVSGTIETDAALKREVRDELQKEIASKYSGRGSAEFGLLMLTHGLKLSQSKLVSPVDADYVQSRKLTAVEIAMIYRIPTILLGLLDGATYDRVAGLYTFLLQNTLQPILRSIVSQLTHKLVPPEQQGSVIISPDLSAALSTTPVEQAEVDASHVQNGLRSRQEVRSRDGLPDHPGLSEFLYPANLAVVGQPAKTMQPPEKPTDNQADDVSPRAWDVSRNRWVAA